MTKAERSYEYLVRYHERIGHLCDDGHPTAEQSALAADEATKACNKLDAQDRRTPEPQGDLL